jgi:hypothetical protein
MASFAATEGWNGDSGSEAASSDGSAEDRGREGTVCLTRRCAITGARGLALMAGAKARKIPHLIFLHGKGMT